MAAHLLLQQDATITAHAGEWLCGGLHMELTFSSVAPSGVLGGTACAQPVAWPDCAVLCGAARALGPRVPARGVSGSWAAEG